MKKALSFLWLIPFFIVILNISYFFVFYSNTVHNKSWVSVKDELYAAMESAFYFKMGTVAFTCFISSSVSIICIIVNLVITNKLVVNKIARILRIMKIILIIALFLSVFPVVWPLM